MARLRFRIATLAAVGALVAVSASAGQGSTVLSGRLLDPIDRGGIDRGRIKVGAHSDRSDADGGFEVEVGPRKQPNLATRFDAPGHSRYRSWTEAGEDLTRDVYLFPTTNVSLPQHEGPVTPEELVQHFDFLYRDPIWTDPEQKNGRLRRWVEKPVIVIDTRTLEEIEEPEWHWVARDKVPGRVRRHVVATLRAVAGPVSAGFLDGVRIRFRRMREGEVIARDIEDVYPAGQIRISFITTGYYHSGGGVRLEGDTIVGGGATLDVDSVRLDEARRSDYLTFHEFAHALGMMHPMVGSHGFTATPLCSIMGGCDGTRRPQGVVWEADQAMARLAYSRMPGNDQHDRDPRPVSGASHGGFADGGPTRYLVFHTPPELLPDRDRRGAPVRFAR